MKKILTLVACAALSLPVFARVNGNLRADTFRSVIGDAANIQKDAEALSRDMKSKTLDAGKIKADIDTLGQHIANLRKDVEQLESHASSFTPAQQKDWALIKEKVQLLTIFHERKTELMNSGDFKKNRAMLRAHADGIAKRAEMLQQTASRLDK